MGVEALLRDRLLAADVHRQQHAAYAALPPARRAAVLPPRRDLELEAIGEILAGERWIHCHSYRQDEILMLCNLVRERGIKVGTFQHVLEGYKVADAIAANAVARRRSPTGGPTVRGLRRDPGDGASRCARRVRWCRSTATATNWRGGSTPRPARR